MHLVRFTLEIYYDAGPYERQICTVCVCVCVCVRTCVVFTKSLSTEKNYSLLAFMSECR